MIKNLNINKASLIILLLNILQILTVIIALSYPTIRKSNFSLLLLLVIIIVIVNSYLFVKDRRLLSRIEEQYQLLKINVSQIEGLNNTLRGQRHDFLNHLQVVYSLMEMQEYKAAVDYIENTYVDIQKVSRLLKTSSPAINALLQAKIHSCEVHEIKVEVKVKSELKNMSIDSWDLCRILGNLIDNSIYALKGIERDKHLLIEILEDITSHKFKISNNGPIIDNKNIEEIFKPGFTSKGEHGDGMGLFIVDEIVKEFRGTVNVQSNYELTVFEVSIPINKQRKSDS